ncbi:MAG: colicin uptake protein, partial [Planctomycetota bacterium]
MCPVPRTLLLTFFVVLVSVPPGFAEVDYAQQVKPILRDHCYACHGAINQESDLRLDTGAFVRAGGGSGPVVVPGNPDESLLLQLVTGEAGYRMPPEEQGKALSEKQVEILRRWIAEGAVSPEDEEPQADPATYWSYQPIERPAVPEVGDAGWVRTPIDAFIAARH